MDPSTPVPSPRGSRGRSPGGSSASAPPLGAGAPSALDLVASSSEVPPSVEDNSKSRCPSVSRSTSEVPPSVVEGSAPVGLVSPSGIIRGT